MTLDQIKTAVNNGMQVHWATDNYVVIKDKFHQYLIHSRCNDVYWGLTHRDEVTINCNDPAEFYIQF
jgi:hypothetical protein